MAADGSGLAPERRAMLAEKGRRLYGKYCGTRGRGVCAESFAVYHLGRGEAVVAADLLAYLEAQAAAGRDAMTHALIARLRHHLAAAEIADRAD